MSDLGLKLPCGCYGELQQRGWVITASAFLCSHKQGQCIPFKPESRATKREDESPTQEKGN